MLDKVRDGDVIVLDSYTGVLEARVSNEVLNARESAKPVLDGNDFGMGRELFGAFRHVAGDAEAGAMVASA
jgi:phosphogluconate dehydratase